MTSRRRPLLIGAFLAVGLSGVAVWGLHTTANTRQGINFAVSNHSIPLYVKLLDFLYRDAHYRLLARQITEGLISDPHALLTYLPRALPIGFLAPFPWQWFDTKGSTGIMRAFSGMEMLLVYFLLPLLIFGAVGRPLQMSRALIERVTKSFRRPPVREEARGGSQPPAREPEAAPTARS